MAEIIRALFDAEENISDALDTMRNASLTTEEALSQLDQEFTEAQERGDLLDGSLEDLRREHEATTVAVRNLQSNFQEINRVVNEYQRGSISADEATDELRREFTNLSSSVSQADGMLGVLQRTMRDVTDSGRATTHAGAVLERQINAIGRASEATDINIDALANGMVKTSVAAREAEDATDDFRGSLYGTSAASYNASVAMQALQRSANDVDDEMDDARNAALSFSGALGVLAAVSESTALEFGSLSVNIGPFNLALRNFLTQVPAILTGMGSMLAIITSLIVAFTTLGAVTGALVAGGALAWFEEFSSQFEESGEAVEALGAALKDLFTAALEPLMTAGNIDLFTGLINNLAQLLNRFAQFAQMMRGDVLDAVSQMEGDVDDLFNAMRVSFELLEPAVIGIINWFTQDLPGVLERFAKLTETIGGDIRALAFAFGALLQQLLDFASVVLAGLTPVLLIAVTALIDLFKILNAIPDPLLVGAIAAGVMTLAVSKLVLSMVGLATTIASVNASMVSLIGTGSFLGSMYGILITAAGQYALTNTTLVGALRLVKTEMWAQVAATKASTISYLKNSFAAKLLSASYASLVGSVLTAAGAFTTETGALTIASIAKGIYAAVTWTAAAAAWTLNAALGVLAGAFSALASPIVGVIALVPILLGLLAQLAGFDVLGGIANFFKGIIGFVKDTIKWVKRLLGLGGGESAGVSGMSMEDIQTESNIDLSFEESTEQNVDVQADPEEKAQLSRVTKDAIEEANSLARRRQGTQ